MNIGEYLGNLRHQHGWKLIEVARRAGITHSYLSQVESGKITTPKPNTLRKLALGYGVDYQELMARMGYTQDAPETPVVVFRGEEHLSREQRRIVQGLIDEILGVSE